MSLTVLYLLLFVVIYCNVLYSTVFISVLYSILYTYLQYEKVWGAYPPPTMDQQVIKITSHMFGPTDPKLSQVCDNFPTKLLPVLEKCYHCYSVMYIMFGFLLHICQHIQTDNKPLSIYCRTKNILFDFA